MGPVLVRNPALLREVLHRITGEDCSKLDLSLQERAQMCIRDSSSRFKDQIIYFGPMGCRTGFYLITRDLTGQPLVDLVIDAFRFIAAYEGEIPGASAKECGNYRDLSLELSLIHI